MKQLDRRTVILLGVVGALVVAFLVWKVVLSGGGSGSTAVQDPATVTTVAGAQAQSDATGTNGTATAGSGSGAQGSTPTTQAFVDTPFDPHTYRNPFTPAG